MFRKTFSAGALAALVLTAAAPPVARAEGRDIVGTAAAAGSFKTLAQALESADLVGTLEGEGPFTVFAPTDEAFAKLPAGTLENLLEPENRDKLRRVLTYHVVPGRVMASDVARRRSMNAVNGDSLTVSATGGVVRVGDARVVKADIPASNGVIHVIDTVILPDGL